MDDELYFQQSAESLLSLMAGSQKKPVHQNARDLSCGELGILYCLYRRQETMSAGDLKRAMDIGSGGVTNLLNALEKKQYISRFADPKDRRSVRIALSESGRSLAEEKEAEALRLTAGMLQKLGRDDTEALIRIYEKMLALTNDCLTARCTEKKETE